VLSLILCSDGDLILQLSRPIVGSDESFDRAVKLVDSREYMSCSISWMANLIDNL